MKKFKIIDYNFRKQITYHVTVLISEQVLESRLDHFPLAKLAKREVQTNKQTKWKFQYPQPDLEPPVNKFCFIHFVVKWRKNSGFFSLSKRRVRWSFSFLSSLGGYARISSLCFYFLFVFTLSRISFYLKTTAPAFQIQRWVFFVGCFFDSF